MKKILKKYWLQIILALIGVAGGYLYWRFVGCKSGSCPITSTWYMSVLAGGILGYLIGDIINDTRVKLRTKREKTVE